MKRILCCFIIFCLISNYGFSQTAIGLKINYLDGLSNKIKESVGSNFSSTNILSAEILGQHYFSDDMKFFRIRIGVIQITSYGETEAFILNGVKQNDLIDSRQLIFLHTYGIGKKLLDYEGLKILGGLELPLRIIGTAKTTVEHDLLYPLGSGQPPDRSKTEIETEGGFSLGLGTFIGAHYNLFSKFTIGMELSYGYRYNDTSGKTRNTEFFNGQVVSFQSEEFVHKDFGFTLLEGSLLLLIGI